MTRVEERQGFEILLEAPPSAQSFGATLVTTADATFAERGGNEQVCLAYTRETALDNARAFVDKVAAMSLKSATY
jgi:hypothetical protein